MTFTPPRLHPAGPVLPPPPPFGVDLPAFDLHSCGDCGEHCGGACPDGRVPGGEALPAIRTWLGASHALGRPVPVDEPYPHICGRTVDGQVTPGLRYEIWRRDCAACTAARHAQTRGEA